MHITIMALGTEGDIRPMVALGSGLLREGYEVRLATTANFANLVKSENLDFALLDGDFKELLSKESEELQKKGNNPKGMEKSLKRMIKSVGPAWAVQGLEACKDTDLIISGSLAVYLAATFAEALKKPFVQVHIAPASLIKDVLMSPSPVMNHILHSAINAMLWQPVRSVVNDILRPQFRLAPYPWFGPQKQLNKQKNPILFGISASVVPHKDTLPEYVRLTGSFILNRAISYEPSKELLEFINSGSKPIYVGFGSVPSNDAEELTKIVLEALRISSHRAILSIPQKDSNLIKSSANIDNIFTIDHVPHDWLFPRVELAVHHGGAGTTAAAISAGIPSVVVPFFGDQNYWAWCLENAGVAPSKIARKKLNAEKLAKAINIALSEEMNTKAKILSSKLREEDGVKSAIKALRDWNLLY